MDQAQALVERAAPQLVTTIGIDGDLQVVETLDFTGYLGYILPGYRGATPLIRLRVSSCNSGSGVYSISSRWQRRCCLESSGTGEVSRLISPSGIKGCDYA